MYGTVARCTVKPENRGKLEEVFERQRDARPIPGFVASYLLHEDAGDTSWLFAVFEDKATYEANADDPAMDADYREYRALMESDPEWHDGVIEGHRASS
jgi:quinol monooxygenase YgiN